MPNCIHAEKLFRQLHSITMNKLKLLWASKRVECRAHAKLECTRFCCCHLFVDYLSNENEWETSESEQLLDWLLVKFTNLYIFNGISDAGKSYETHENLFKKQRFVLECNRIRSQLKLHPTSPIFRNRNFHCYSIANEWIESETEYVLHTRKLLPKTKWRRRIKNKLKTKNSKLHENLQTRNSSRVQSDDDGRVEDVAHTARR